MKKLAIYTLILVVGLVLGWVFFGHQATTDNSSHKHTDSSEQKKMWTCAMHPQIMQPEPGKCPICGMDLIPAEVGADGLTKEQFKLTNNAMALADVQTTVLGTGKIEKGTVTLSGKIVENEETNVIQVAYFSGRIEQLYINFTGEKVQKGQLLASIYSPELVAAQQELITASSLKDTQAALYQAVRNKLKLWKLSDVQIDQIETSGKVKENFPVYATVSGTVSEKLVEQGDYVKQGQPLLKIANLNTVWADFDVYENQIDLFKKGQTVMVETNAYPGREFKSKVAFIDPVLNTQTRTVKLRTVLENVMGRLKPGMFVEGTVSGLISHEGEVLTIPASAVLWTGKRSVVYLKASLDRPVFEMKEITLGNKRGDSYLVLNGLAAGDEIVTNGTFTVDAAAQLQGKKSMMNQEDRKKTMSMEQSDGSTPAKEKRVQVPLEFQRELKNVFAEYTNLKNALVAGNFESARSSSQKMQVKMGQVDMELLKDAKVHKKWMQLENEINNGVSAFETSKNIDQQRDHFKALSLKMAEGLTLFGINQKVYLQFCPMADDNKGAYWLSLDKEILNPYFGDLMLSCGSTVNEIN
ncbi:MAG: efflux RND transporter periplasmic adaptor subunit [Flavobacteriaceae bacterium]|nr:efflux RND transporter periplasmic adaptor subunit [Flavobacteriaceae bacterium]